MVPDSGALGRHRSGVNSLALNRRGELLFSAGRYFALRVQCKVAVSEPRSRGPAGAAAAPAVAGVGARARSTLPCCLPRCAAVAAGPRVARATGRYRVEDAIGGRPGAPIALCPCPHAC